MTSQYLISNLIMEILFSLFIFLFGLFVGSFLNCVIYRLEKKESFLRGRSYCPKCRHKLNWYDLIPIFSFLALAGKCRYCHKKISIQYPLVELATGLIFLLCFLLAPYQALFWCGVFCFLIIIFVYDLKHYIIPDKILLPAILVVFLYNLFFHFKFLLFNFLPAAFTAGIFFLMIFLISRGKWLGFGDVKLVFLMGLLLGFPNILVALFLAFFFGAIIGIGLIIFGKKKLKSEIPFGPFLITGTFIAMLWGEELIDWYLGLIL